MTHVRPIGKVPTFMELGGEETRTTLSHCDAKRLVAERLPVPDFPIVLAGLECLHAEDIGERLARWTRT